MTVTPFTKRAIELLALIGVVPVWLTFRAHARCLGRDRACAAVAQRAARWSGLGGEYRRRILLRLILARVGENAVVSFGALLTKSSIELGDRVYIGAYSLLGDVRIGDDTLIADHVCIPSGPHQHGIEDLDVPIREQPGRPRVVRIGRDCWIGSGAVILADIGDHCVVGAGSVVTKPVGDYQIVAGNPARPIADRREKTV